MRLIKEGCNKFFSLIEKYLSINWLNPVLTIYLNLRSFPFAQAVKMPVWIYGRPRLMCLSGKMQIEGKVCTGMIRFNFINIGSPSNMGIQSEINNQGVIIFHGAARIRTGNRIVVGYKAVLKLGGNIIIGDMCNLGCFKSIQIGHDTRIAHRSQIFDSNYHYVANFTKRVVPNIYRSIVIGNYCWICNSVSIAGGTNIPDSTIVSTNSLLNKDFSTIEPGSIVGGIPAKFIASGYKLVNNRRKEMEIAHFYNTRDNEVYHLPEDIPQEDWFNW